MKVAVSVCEPAPSTAPATGAHAVAARFSEPLDALADAEKTGRLTIRPDAVVRAITIDDAGRVSEDHVGWLCGAGDGVQEQSDDNCPDPHDGSHPHGNVVRLSRCCAIAVRVRSIGRIFCCDASAS